MKLFRKTVRCVLAAAVAVCLGTTCVLSSNADTDPKDRYSGTADSIAVPLLEAAKKSEVHFGDVDYSSGITTTDALCALQGAVGKIELKDDEIERANVDASADADGNPSVTTADALLILQRAVRLEVDFPAESAVADQWLSSKGKLKFREDGTFHLLQVSDLQDNCNSGESLKEGTKQRLEAMIEATDPDLVIFTGDQIWPNGLTDEAYFIRYVDRMTEMLEEKGIAWGIVFGNHDNETGYEGLNSTVRKWRQIEIYESYPHCVAVSGDPDIFGVGNYVIPILSNDESRIEFNVWCLDTGDYTRNIDKTVYDTSNTEYYSQVDRPDKYDFIKYDQQLWYYNTSTILENYNGGQKITGAMFGHICLPEFKDMYQNREDESVHFTGYRKEEECCASVNSHMFDTILARGDVKGYYTGHDHINNYSGMWQGIELAYGGSLTTDMYGSYNTNLPSPETQGGRLFTIVQGENGDAATYTSKFVSYDSVKNSATAKKTLSIGKAPFSGDILSMESGLLPVYRAKGFDSYPFDIDCLSAPTLSAASGKGFRNGNALAVLKGGDRKVSDPAIGRIDNCCLGVTLDSVTNAGSNKYLRVWVDFTGVDFRKAGFGLVGTDGTVYCTDYKDGASAPFYYLPEDSDTWQTFYHGADGCFGTAQSSSVADFKGWLAFPISDFATAESTGANPSSASVKEMFFFFDFADVNMVGSAFYFDEIGLVPEYWVF